MWLVPSGVSPITEHPLTLPAARKGFTALAGGLERVTLAGEEAWLNIKHARKLTVRNEYEYAIPIEDAESLLESACRRPLVDKTRHIVEHGSHVWEVDVFHGENDGLVIAEIELRSEDESFVRPTWLGADVSEDPRYLNQNLSRHPFTRWGDDNGED